MPERAGRAFQFAQIMAAKRFARRAGVLRPGPLRVSEQTSSQFIFATGGRGTGRATTPSRKGRWPIRPCTASEQRGDTSKRWHDLT